MLLVCVALNDSLPQAKNFGAYIIYIFNSYTLLRVVTALTRSSEGCIFALCGNERPNLLRVVKSPGFLTLGRPSELQRMLHFCPTYNVGANLLRVVKSPGFLSLARPSKLQRMLHLWGSVVRFSPSLGPFCHLGNCDY